MEQINHAAKAHALFRQGYNCAQSVVGAFHEEIGLPLETALRLSSSFGGGMGGLREYCGAVSAMYMVVGLLYGYSDADDYDAKKTHYARIRELSQAFVEKHDTTVCRELLKSLPGKLQQDPMPRTEEYYKIRPCIRFVESAASILDEFIAKQQEKPLA